MRLGVLFVFVAFVACTGTTEPMKMGPPTKMDMARDTEDMAAADVVGDMSGDVSADMEDAAEDMRDEDVPEIPEPGPCAPEPAEEGVYPEDPEIVALLQALPSGSGLSLPKTTVENRGHKVYDSHKGPPHRDYSNAMVFVPERHTALYAGGSHGTYRANDVWEYHLGSNAWVMLHEPIGGNAGPHKAAVFALNAQYDGRGIAPSPELQEKIDAFKPYAKEHLQYTSGRFMTLHQAPFMPSHQWDGLTYDPHGKRMIWRSGAHVELADGAIAAMLDLDVDEVTAQRDMTVTPMWTFDPATATWARYAHEEPSSIATLRGMGASATYVSSLCATMHYVSAQNVSPQAHEMWTHNSVTNDWTRIAPNGGEGIRHLVQVEGVAPASEAQMAYSSRHDKLVAVLGGDTFVYDVPTQVWSKALTDERVNAHDARTVFVYDPNTDTFFLFDMTRPSHMLAYTLSTNTWDVREVQGDAFPKPPYNNTMGYYDPIHRVVVIANARNRGVWVYRP